MVLRPFTGGWPNPFIGAGSPFTSRVSGGGFTGVLPGLSVQPIIALDIRRLTGTSWETDDPIATIRETGGDTDDSFSYTGSPPILDFAGIATHVGANAGRWDKWFNQIEGNDAANSTDATQPLFVDRAGPDFDGSSQFLEIPHAANQLLTGGFTIVIGMSPASATGSGSLVQKGSDTAQTDGFWLYENGAGALNMRVNSATTATSSAVMTTGFQHWIVTVTAAGAVTFYRNNVAAGSGTTGACSGITAAQAISLGRRRGDGTYHDGAWDALDIFPGVITADDRAALFAAWQTYRLADAFATDGWSVADKETDGAVTVTIATLPDDKDSAITDLEYRLDGGSAVSFGAAVTGDYDITGLTNDQLYSLQVRAVNSAGNGSWSAAKTVTPTLASFTGILDDLSVTPIFAASTRRLTSGFTGNIATIREDGSNGEDSFSYTGDPPTLDFAAINSFIGVNDGWWKGWQNQVAGNSAAQTVQANQPLYVDANGPDFGSAANTYYFTVAHAANQLLTSGFTIVARIKPRSAGESSFGRIVDKATGGSGANGFVFFVGSNAQILASVAGTPTLGVASSNNAAPLNTWTNAAVTVAAAGATTLYANNVSVGTGTCGACSGITTTNALAIGYSTALAGRQFDGLIESLFIFPGVLGSSDRAALNTWLG